LRLIAGGWFVLREKYCWLVADKPSEQGGTLEKALCESDSLDAWASLEEPCVSMYVTV
jgi:hypothetical protein